MNNYIWGPMNMMDDDGSEKNTMNKIVKYIIYMYNIYICIY